MANKYKFLPHTADVKFQAFGKNLNEAFENAAKAAFSVMYEGKVKSIIHKKIKVRGKDLESLLYNFIEELIFLLDSQNFFLSTVKVKINKEKLKLEADLSGDKAGNYKIILDVKAVTYNQMYVKKHNNKYIVQVVLDV